MESSRPGYNSSELFEARTNPARLFMQMRHGNSFTIQHFVSENKTNGCYLKQLERWACKPIILLLRQQIDYRHQLAPVL